MYVLVAIIKKRLHIDLSLYTILQILSITLFEKNAGLSDIYRNKIQKQNYYRLYPVGIIRFLTGH